jgi:HSP20 family protein
MLTVDFDRAFPPGSLLRDMQRLQGEMNQVFSGYSRPAPNFPAINAWRGQNGLLLTCELPGVDPDSLDISVVGDTLTLRGTRAPEALSQGDTYHRQERGYGKFSRTLQLPFRVESNEVSAEFANGVLTLRLPQAEADRPRKIQVKTA